MLDAGRLIQTVPPILRGVAVGREIPCTACRGSWIEPYVRIASLPTGAGSWARVMPESKCCKVHVGDPWASTRGPDCAYAGASQRVWTRKAGANGRSLGPYYKQNEAGQVASTRRPADSERTRSVDEASIVGDAAGRSVPARRGRHGVYAEDIIPRDGV